MKQIKKYISLCLIFLSIMSVNSRAYDPEIVIDPPFEYNGIYYCITSKINSTVEVTNPPSSIDNSFHFYSGIVNIPDSIVHKGQTYTVTSIQNSAFRGQSDLTTVVIPPTVKLIDYRAFRGCVNLSSVMFKSNSTLERIEREAFYGCAISSITIPNSVKYLGDDIFSGCGKLKSFKGGESVEIIGDNAFQGCNSLTEITIPNSVTKIGNYAFWECNNLRKVVMGNSLKTIGNDAFLQCVVLEDVIFSDSVEEIGWEAFRWCLNLKHIEIPNSVVSMDYGVFRYCTGLEEVTLSNSLKEIPSWAFEQTAIKKLIIPNSVKKIMPYAFTECPYLANITWGESIESIGTSSFSGDTCLIEVTIPESVTGIGSFAFSYCKNIKEVTIPRRVTGISDKAFDHCTKLKDAYVLATVPPVIPYNTGIFGNCDNPVRVHIYEGLKDVYESTLGWAYAVDMKQTVIIDDIPALKTESIVIDKAEYYCEIGEVGNATATIYPEDVMSHELSWSSDDESVLYIEEYTGQFIGLSKGVVTISAKATDGSGVFGTAKVYVGYGEGSGISTMSNNDGYIYVKNRIIYTNNPNCRVYNTSGYEISIDKQLPEGIYIVVDGKKARKVIVK